MSLRQECWLGNVFRVVSSLKLDSSFRSLNSGSTSEVNGQNAFPMTRRIQISIVAALALIINSVCLCVAAMPSCTASSCAAHERHGACPPHSQHRDSHGGHQCCQSAACGGPTEIGASTDSLGGNHVPAPLPAIIRAPIFDLGDAPLRLIAPREAHSPPSAVPVFLAFRSLLL
jgi:hypothetical protein